MLTIVCIVSLIFIIVYVSNKNNAKDSVTLALSDFVLFQVLFVHCSVFLDLLIAFAEKDYVFYTVLFKKLL